MILTDEKLLRVPSKSVSIFEGVGIIKKLEYELQNSPIAGVGLSGVQIGIDASVCIIRSNISLDLINPKVINKYDLSFFDQEGCLSYPNIFIATKRYNEIVIKDILHPAGIILTGINAVIVQHEIDHTLGKVMFDYEVKTPKGPNSKCWCGSGRKFKTCCKGKETTGAHGV